MYVLDDWRNHRMNLESIYADFSSMSIKGIPAISEDSLTKTWNIVI